MSSPAPITNQRQRHDPLLGGQLLLLAVAVGATAVFSFLYISKNQAPPAVAVTPPPLPSAAATTGDQAVVSTHEQTRIMVEQVLVVGSGDGQSPEKVLVRTPAVFPSGTVQWNPEQLAHARILQSRMVAVLRHQEAIGREIEGIELEWQALVKEGVPKDTLLPDSPSIPRPNEASPKS